MKKIILLAFAISTLFGCSSSSDSSDSSTTNYKWSFKLDGVLYQWEGQKGGMSGGSYTTTSNNLGNINLIKFSELSVSIRLPQISEGTFTIDQNSSSSYFDINILLGGENYSTLNGNSSSMNVNITSLPPLGQNSQSKVIGTFSGTIKRFGGANLSTVTEGKFEIWRE